LVAATRNGSTNENLVCEWSIELGCVKKRNPEVDSAVDRSERLRVVAFVIRPSPAHAPETEFGDGETLRSECAFVHRLTIRASRPRNQSSSEIAYVSSLAGEQHVVRPDRLPGTLTRGALAAIEWAPAYVCTYYWSVLEWNRAMSLVWGIGAPGGEPFNILTLMFRNARVRAMHGARFPAFARSLVAMVVRGSGRA